jgi:hypothetical protein
MADITAPILKRLTLPATIDLSKGAYTFEASAEAVDESGGSGIAQVTVWFDQRLAFADYRSPLLQLGGSWMKDNFADATPTVSAHQFTVQEKTPAGTYNIDQVWVTDVAGNRTTYTPQQLKAMGIATTMAVTGKPVDTTGPTLTTLGLPKTVDMSAGDVSLTVSAGARDNADGTGIDYVMLTFDKPLSVGGNSGSLMLLGIVGDSFDDATPTSAATPVVIGKATAPGTYRILDATVHDHAGNETRYSVHDLEAMGIATTMTVTGSTADTSPPELLDLWLPRTVALQSDVQQVVAASARDNNGGTGIRSVYLQFDRQLALSDRPSDVMAIGLYGTLDDYKDVTPGMGMVPFSLTGATVPGTYNLAQAWLYDNAGNMSMYTAQQLQQRGINTEMTVVAQAPTATIGARVDEGALALSLTSGSWATSEYDRFSLTVKYDPAQLRYSGVSLARAPAALLSAEVSEAGSTGKVTITGTGLVPADAVLKLALNTQAGSSVLHYAVDGFTVNDVPQAFGDHRVGSVVAGTKGNDVITPGLAATFIDGRDGLDRVVFDDGKIAYTMTRSSAGLVVENDAGMHLTLANVERVAFRDYTLALDIDGAAGQVYRLYQAAFDRRPDDYGLGYWMKMTDNGTSLVRIADAFILSREFAFLYGFAPSAEEFVTALYDNVLHREPDAKGYGYWVDAIKSGVARADVLIQFSESPENVAQVVAQIGNGFTYFT